MGSYCATSTFTLLLCCSYQGDETLLNENFYLDFKYKSTTVSADEILYTQFAKPETLVAMATDTPNHLQFDMKLFPILYLFLTGHIAFGQDQNLLQHKKHFDTELKQWTKSFGDFSLSDFKLADTLHFDNNYAQDLKSLKEFLSVYKPVITYSVDSSKFIDIYSYQLNLEKKRNYYEANPGIDQAILLCDPKAKYWNRIFFGTSSQWIDEVVWLSKTQFILAGITKSGDDKRQPLILVGDTNKQSLLKYVDTNKQTFQSEKGYSSLKLKRIKIKGL